MDGNCMLSSWLLHDLLAREGPQQSTALKPPYHVQTCVAYRRAAASSMGVEKLQAFTFKYEVLRRRVEVGGGSVPSLPTCCMSHLLGYFDFKCACVAACSWHWQLLAALSACAHCAAVVRCHACSKSTPKSQLSQQRAASFKSSCLQLDCC
jgi:hypothetical protein